MEGVTTAIVGFIFVCVVYPNLVKYKPQYYGALALVVLVIVLDALERVIANPGFDHFAMLFIAVSQVGAILLLILGCGGVTVRTLAADVGKTIEVIRRGGEKETIIVPLTGEQPKSRD